MKSPRLVLLASLWLGTFAACDGDSEDDTGSTTAGETTTTTGDASTTTTGDGDSGDGDSAEVDTGDGDSGEVDTGDGDGDGCSDASEPNDDVGSATPMGEEIKSGTSCPGDVDMYRITAQDGAWAMIDATFSGGDINLYLMQADGTTLVGSSTAGNPIEHIEAWQIPAGDYIVIVEHVSGDAVSYDLEVALHD